MQTAQIIKATVDRPLHMRPASALVDARVSSSSYWPDPIWRLDNPSVGQRVGASHLNWSIALPNDANLLEPAHARMLDWLRRLAWSLFADPREKARAYKAGNASQLTQGMRRLVPWLVGAGVSLPSQIDRVIVDAFIDDLPDLVFEDKFDETITEGEIYLPLKFLDLIWRQRAALSDAGVKPMPRRPWDDERGANTIVKRIATEARGWIRPLPDEVVIPIVNQAAFFLGKPADDVIRFAGQVERVRHDRSIRSASGAFGAGRGSRTRPTVATRLFEFSSSTDSGAPWHPAVDLIETVARVTPLERVRQLKDHVTAAACIAIQSSTGMRASEICALRSGVDEVSGLPVDVRIERSASGLNEVFVLRSERSKGEETPKADDWLLGMRPLGSEELPLPIRAILVLNPLLETERELKKSGRLVVKSREGISILCEADDVAELDSGRLNLITKKFVARWVDLTGLPDESAHRISANDLVPWRESSGQIIRPAQFRKTYAQFALAVDPRLLPAVQRQFHHISMAMTEAGYWGRNPIQVEPIDAVSAQMTAMQLYELATGRTKVAGRRGVALAERIDEVKKLLEGESLEAGWRRVVRFVRDESLHMWFTPAGNCMPTSRTSMECHKVAGTRPLGVRTPNFSTREPSLCAGCACFIMDLRHVGYWQERYVSNRVAFEAAERRGQGGLFRVARQRAEVARKLLRRIGVDVAALDDRVRQELSHASS